MKIQIEQNGQFIEVSKEQLFQMAATDQITSDTPIRVGKRESTAGKVNGIKFKKHPQNPKKEKSQSTYCKVCGMIEVDGVPSCDCATRSNEPVKPENTCFRCGKIIEPEKRHECFVNANKTKEESKNNLALICIAIICALVIVAAGFWFISAFAMTGTTKAHEETAKTSETEPHRILSSEAAEEGRFRIGAGVTFFVICLVVFFIGCALDISTEEKEKKGCIGCGGLLLVISILTLISGIRSGYEYCNMTEDEWQKKVEQKEADAEREQEMKDAKKRKLDREYEQYRIDRNRRKMEKEMKKNKPVIIIINEK